MAERTVELRNLLKTNFELFDFEYSFDDNNFKEQIEEAVIDYYYFHEIGSETPDKFKQRFKSRWKRLIPYYNRLHNTTLLEYNPLINSKITESLEQLSKTNNTGTTTSLSDVLNNGLVENSATGNVVSNTTSDNTNDVIGSSTTDNKITSSGTSHNETNTDSTSITDGNTTTNTESGTTTGETGSSTNNNYSESGNFPQNMSDSQSGELNNFRESATASNGTSTDKKDSSTSGSSDTIGTSKTTGTTSSDSVANGTSSDTSQANGKGTSTNKTTGTNNSNSVSDNVDASTTKTNGTAKNTTTGSSEGITDTNSSYAKVIEGMTGTTYQQLILLERENMLRIIDLIIVELKTLFILVY